jgi:excisionase family DNA binding protein
LLLPCQVASLLTMTTRAVVKMARAGELPYVELPDGEILIDRADLLRWVQARRRPARWEAPDA